MSTVGSESHSGISLGVSLLKILMIGCLSVKLFDPSVTWVETLGLVLTWFLSISAIMIGALFSLGVMALSLRGREGRKAILSPQVIQAVSLGWPDTIAWFLFHLMVLGLLVNGGHIATGVVVLIAMVSVPLMRGLARRIILRGVQEEVSKSKTEEIKESPIFSALREEESQN